MALAACGDDTDGGGSGGGDGGAAPSAGSTGAGQTASSSSTGDASSSSSSGDAASSSASSSSGGFVCGGEGFDAQQEVFQDLGDGNFYYQAGIFHDDDTFDAFNLSFWQGRLEVGSDAFSNAGYEGCTLCLLMESGCVPDSDPFYCEKSFLADVGSIEVESVSGDFVATLHGVQLVQITLEEGFSTPVPGGETWCIDDYEIDAPIEQE